MHAIDTCAASRPLIIDPLEVKNRIVMAPMTRTVAVNGMPTEATAAYYRRRAKGPNGNPRHRPTIHLDSTRRDVLRGKAMSDDAIAMERDAGKDGLCVKNRRMK